MGPINLRIERERLEKFDYSVRSKVKSFLTKVGSKGVILSENKYSPDNGITTTTDILKASIVTGSHILHYVNYKERYFDFYKIKNGNLIKDIICYVFNDFLCDFVDYIEANQAKEKSFDKDLVINVEDIKKNNLKEVYEERFDQEIFETKTSCNEVYKYHNLDIKEANGFTYDDGDSTCVTLYSVEQKKSHAVWFFKRWISSLVFGD